MPTTAIQTGFADAPELRRKNRATVEQYMHSHGAGRLRRHELFTRTAAAVPGTPPAPPAGLPRPRQAGGPGCLAGQCLPGLAVAQRADLRNRRPESLLGRKRRARQREYARLPEGYCENHYIHSFDSRMADQRNASFQNAPSSQLARPSAFPVPTMFARARPTRLIHNQRQDHVQSQTNHDGVCKPAPSFARKEPPGGRAVHADQGPGPPAPPRTLFTGRTAAGGLWTTDTGTPLVDSRKEQARRARGSGRLKCFPRLGMYDIRISNR